MKLGIHLPQMGGGTAEEIARVAVRAEQAGYHSIWVSDHLLVPETGGNIPPIEIMDPIPTLAYAAALTKTIRLATSVLVVPYRNAIHLGKELATLDRLSNGRLIVGAASGWLEAEFNALGAPYQKRGAYTDEAIRLWRELWSQPDAKLQRRVHEAVGHALWPATGGGKNSGRGSAASASAHAGAQSKLGDGWHGTRMKPEEAAQSASRWIREIAARIGKSLDGIRDQPSCLHRICGRVDGDGRLCAGHHGATA